jgi:ABC-type sulfate transport system permease subunit
MTGNAFVRNDWKYFQFTSFFIQWQLFYLIVLHKAVAKVSRGSSVSIVSGYGLSHRAIEVRSPAEAKGFLL